MIHISLGTAGLSALAEERHRQPAYTRPQDPRLEACVPPPPDWSRIVVAADAMRDAVRRQCAACVCYADGDCLNDEGACPLQGAVEQYEAVRHA